MHQRGLKALSRKEEGEVTKARKEQVLFCRTTSSQRDAQLGVSPDSSLVGIPGPLCELVWDGLELRTYMEALWVVLKLPLADYNTKISYDGQSFLPFFWIYDVCSSLLMCWACAIEPKCLCKLPAPAPRTLNKGFLSLYHWRHLPPYL